MKALMPSVLILSSTFVYGQTFSALELINLCKCKTFLCANNGITARNFRYDSYQVEEKSAVFTFLSKDYDYYGDNDFQMYGMAQFRYVESMNTTTISYMTCNKLYYSTILRQFETEGYKEIGTETYKTAVITKFRNKRYPKLCLLVNVATMPVANGHNYLTYAFDLVTNYEWGD